MQGRIALNSVCPRFLDQRAFDVFWRNSERGAMGIALHEMTHFVWFSVWQRHFHDTPAEYDTPHLKWMLSEMVVECYLSHPALRALDPYFEPENGGCIYPYFYDLTLDGAPLLEHLHRLFIPGGTRGFYGRCVGLRAAPRARHPRAHPGFGKLPVLTQHTTGGIVP